MVCIDEIHVDLLERTLPNADNSNQFRARRSISVEETNSSVKTASDVSTSASNSEFLVQIAKVEPYGPQIFVLLLQQIEVS